MADYDLLYQDTYIDALLATANELKTAGYIYKGVATPSTNPGTPSERVAYLASEPGTYTNFGGIVIASGLYSLTYANGTWTGTQMSAGSDIEVVQTIGDSTTDVMSQKAVTDEITLINDDINAIINKTNYVDRLPLVTTTNNKFVWYSNGQVTYSTLKGFVYTDFIFIGDCNKMKIPACHQWGCVFFDGSKQYNGDYHTSTDVGTPVTINIPSGSQYVQVNLKKTDPQYVDCYFTTPLRELSLNIRTSLILNRDGNELILPLDRIITDPTGSYITLNENRFTTIGETTGGYMTASQSEDVWTTTWHTSQYHNCTDYIDIHDSVKITIGCDVTANLVYFDENKVCCGNFVGNGSLTSKTTIPPSNAYYVRQNYDKRYISRTTLICYYNANTYNINPIINIPNDNIKALKPLSGLKVAWYGTSIPDGYPYQDTDQDTYSYANRAVMELGGIIQNRCVSGGFLISATNTADTHNQTSRFTDIDPNGTYYSPINYQTQVIDLIGTDNEPDIFVFDYGANDGQFYQGYFDSVDLDNVDITTEDIRTFIGAYNTIIKALLTAKPKARIFLVTHYSDDGQSNEMTRKDGYRTMNRLIEKIADYWHIPCNPVYKKTGWIYNRNGISNIRSQWCKDGIHPANSANIGSIEFLTKIHKQFLMENHCY
jgi:hypothetical protein